MSNNKIYLKTILVIEDGGFYDEGINDDAVIEFDSREISSDLAMKVDWVKEIAARNLYSSPRDILLLYYFITSSMETAEIISKAEQINLMEKAREYLIGKAKRYAPE